MTPGLPGRLRSLWTLFLILAQCFFSTELPSLEVQLSPDPYGRRAQFFLGAKVPLGHPRHGAMELGIQGHGPEPGLGVWSVYASPVSSLHRFQ